MRGWAPASALGEIWRQASVSVVPSWFETFGQSALGSMQWGVPVVATKAGGLPELVRDGCTGLLCEIRDEDGMVAALVDLLSCRESAAQMGLAAAREVETSWLWQDRVQIWYDTLSELVAANI